MKWLKKALGRAGRKVAEEHVTKGYIAVHDGHLDQAQKHYNDAIDADDSLAVAWFNAGQTELLRFNRDAAGLDDEGRAARLAAAVGFLEKAVALEPTHAPSWRTLGRVRERQGGRASALAAWQRCLALLGEGSEPKERDEARKEIERLSPEADLEVALDAARAALADVGDDAPTKAAAQTTALQTLLSTWERVSLRDVVEPPRLWSLAGSLARKAGDARARALLEQAVQRDKHDLEAHKELATLCLAQGDLKAALASSVAAYREDPVDAGLVCNVGVCHLALGDLARAEEFISLASSLDDSDPIVARALAALRAAQEAKPGP